MVISMVDTLTKKLTKAEFWAIADAADITYELINGVAVAKISPKYLHVKSRTCLFRVLDR